MAKIMSLLKAVPKLAPSAFRDYWHDSYLSELLAIPSAKSGLDKVVHNHVQPSSIREGEADVAPPAWAGIAEMWFRDRAAMDALLASGALSRLAQDHADTI